MSRLTRVFAAFGRDARGATAIEYGLICALLVVAILVALGNFGDATEAMWALIQSAITTAS